MVGFAEKIEPIGPAVEPTQGMMTIETGGVCLALAGLSRSLGTDARARYGHFLVDAAPTMQPAVLAP